MVKIGCGYSLIWHKILIIVVILGKIAYIFHMIAVSVKVLSFIRRIRMTISIFAQLGIFLL
ncbi:MAG: hypothetical protein Q8942_11145, partial [Bacillota bacterium]|nr:hypothetical protein [Bacillota bacterium]